MLHPVETVVEALHVAGGIVAIACAKLNISRQTYYNWEKDHPELLEVRDSIKEDLLDLAEAGILKAMRNGDREACRFYLRCFGKKRGWIEDWRIMAPGKPGEPGNDDPAPEVTVIILPSNGRELLPPTIDAKAV